MANDLNQCNFIGRLGKDPEVRYMANGKAVCGFSLAVGWKGKDTEGAEWVNVTAFEKLAEICGEYLKKGAQVFVSGRFKNEKYTDKEGIERYTVKIIADRMQMLGSKSDGESTGQRSERQPPPARKPTRAGEAASHGSAGTGTGFDDMDDDVPF